MTQIDIETYAGKFNQTCYQAFVQSLRLSRGEGHRRVDPAHLLHFLLAEKRSDLSVMLDTAGERGAALQEIEKALAAFDKNVTETPRIAPSLRETFEAAWTDATLKFADAQIRSGHILHAIQTRPDLAHRLAEISQTLSRASLTEAPVKADQIWSGSVEASQGAMDGHGLGRAGAEGSVNGDDGTTLGKYTTDLTARAASGVMDPIVGRDAEIRQVADILLRRRQNNPILTGEAGVGKTAVVEGLAQQIAAGTVPPRLQNLRLLELDLQALQAGASMRGEFEQRLKTVIDEVQASDIQIILFIDEAHMLVGAGGNAGTSDAANLLKPALARGTLRTIGATTWAEYRSHFEKDPALTRRFQPVAVEEPDADACCYMIRTITGPLEEHHGVSITDEAITAAVSLSARYVPARQLPDKAVSLLDTACARVATSLTTRPARLADLDADIGALETERTALTSHADLVPVDSETLTRIQDTLTELSRDRDALEADYAKEKALVEQMVEADAADARAALDKFDRDQRMIFPFVDEGAVASVISDWTGIPVGRMVQNEVDAVIQLDQKMKARVIGQDHAIDAIAEQVRVGRVGLSDPSKPRGVFLLYGPSGVGKTETALALAEAIYGGEQNVITINMSEFQESHSVSLLKGAPPGYVGFGEGGRLTEAVRRKPYSVVLLDEVEKAHSDVHELFFQVFDKGVMEDGSGRMIDFKNTFILLTSNAGTDAVVGFVDRIGAAANVEHLDDAALPHLLQVFPPALIGRMKAIPYFPLGDTALRGIARLKLDAVMDRAATVHAIGFSYDDSVLDAVLTECSDAGTGARMIDKTINRKIQPLLARHILSAGLGHKLGDIRISTNDNGAISIL